MAKHSKHTIRFWEEGAVSFLCDITDQLPIKGMEDTALRMSKLGRNEAQRMLMDIAGALGLEWGEYIHSLAEAWRVRRDLKAAKLGWFEGEGGGTRPPRKPQARVRRAEGHESTGETWVQLCLF